MAKKQGRSRRRKPAGRQARVPAAVGEQSHRPQTSGSAVDLQPLSSAVRAVAKSFAVVALRLAEGKLTSSGTERVPNVGPRARFLRVLGLEPDEIAAVLGSTERSVSELLSRARRAKAKRRG
jgi:hypothetical protein